MELNSCQSRVQATLSTYDFDVLTCADGIEWQALNVAVCIVNSSSVRINGVIFCYYPVLTKPLFHSGNYCYSKQAQGMKKMCLRYFYSANLLKPATFYYLAGIQRDVLKTSVRKCYLIDIYKKHSLYLQEFLVLNFTRIYAFKLEVATYV